MCLFNQNPTGSAPTLPVETAAMQQPDAGAIKTAAQRRTTEQIGSAPKTILTSGSGVTTRAATAKRAVTPGKATVLTSSPGLAPATATDKKTLLGQ